METKRSKYILAGLTVLCVLLICITSLKDGIMEPLRTGVGYFLIPIQTGVNAVGTGIYNELKDYGSLKDALRENEELKTQIVQLTEDNNLQILPVHVRPAFSSTLLPGRWFWGTHQK